MDQQGENRTGRRRLVGRPAATLLGVALAVALVTSACTSGGSAPVASRSPGVVAGAEAPKLIVQPVVKNLNVAPASQRVDMAMPTFSDPTTITNPLFPVPVKGSVLQLGRVDGQAFRAEVTLLPDTRIIEWEGQKVETLVSQYAAYLDGRLHEVAYDFYAQADDGAVWYFGEDVFNFKDGTMSDTHGTWITGKDGPAAMIMPSDPKVGDVYRPENIPGLVFEEVTVKSVGQTFDGPFGPIEGGIVIEELHMDGAKEAKTFAPGYGEFFISLGGDVEATTLVAPTDAVSEPLPAELATLRDGASAVFQAARSKDWSAASATARTMAAAWETYRAGEVHKMIESQMSSALKALAGAIASRNVPRAQQAAIDVGQSSFDLQLRYRPVAQIDLARFDLWLDQLVVDAAAGDRAAVNGDFFTLDYIRDRILHIVDSGDVIRVNSQLEELYGAIGNADLPAAADAATLLRDIIGRLATAS